jgi:DNA-binding NarL/FixJ family response regulator
MMSAKPCLVLYGNSVFLAGIQAELERAPTLELLTIESGRPDVLHLLRERKPCAVLFDLGMDQPSFATAILRELPHLLMIGVDPSSDEMLVLTSHPVQALAVRDLVPLILEASQLQAKNSQGKQIGEHLEERDVPA